MEIDQQTFEHLFDELNAVRGQLLSGKINLTEAKARNRQLGKKLTAIRKAVRQISRGAPSI
jgi:hypothetical protein